MASFASLESLLPIPRSFYLDSPDEVARKLLGKLLVRPSDGPAPRLSGRIVEVEAYFGAADPAAHAYGGKTARNSVLFGPPGHAYVYFIYGMHFCLNVSCEPEGHPGCVLIRALEPLDGLDGQLTSGPGRLCRAFGITRERDNGVDLTWSASTLQIQADDFVSGHVLVTRRIGLRKAADRMARFVLEGSKGLAKPKTEHDDRGLKQKKQKEQKYGRVR